MDLSTVSTAELVAELDRREKAKISARPEALDIIEQIDEARREFGDYTFGDRGPREVINIGKIADTLRVLPNLERGQILKEVLDNYPDDYYSSLTVNCVIVQFSGDWISNADGLPEAEFDELLGYDDRFEY